VQPSAGQTAGAGAGAPGSPGGGPGSPPGTPTPQAGAQASPAPNLTPDATSGAGGEGPLRGTIPDPKQALVDQYGEKDPNANTPVPGGADTAKLTAYRQNRDAANYLLARSRQQVEEANQAINAPDPAAGKTPDELQDDPALTLAQAKWQKAHDEAVQKLPTLQRAEAVALSNLRGIDTQIATEIEGLGTRPGGPNNPTVQEVPGPDGRPRKIQWVPNAKEPNGGHWIELPGIDQGATPLTTHAQDMGTHVVIYDDAGHIVQDLQKDQLTAPTVLGSTSGPKLEIWDPRTNSIQTIDNPGHVPSKTQLTAAPDVEFIATETDGGDVRFTQNPNYNRFGAQNRIVGTGAAEGKIMNVDKDGNVTSIDLLSPAERADIAAKAHAETEGIVADTAKKTLDAAIAKKQQEAMDVVHQAIENGASPSQVRALIQNAAKDVSDYVALQNAETQRQQGLETQRHDLATEQTTERDTRTREAEAATTGAQSYAQYGLATAPFQTALLGSQAPIADPTKLGQSMNVAPSVYQPVADSWAKQQADLDAARKSQRDVEAKQNEPYASPYGEAKAVAQGTTQGNQPAPQQQPQPAAQPQAPAQQPAPQAPARQPIPEGGNVGQNGYAQRQPGGSYTGSPEGNGRAAVDLGNGLARTYYDDQTYEDWAIPQQQQDQQAGVGLGGGQQGQTLGNSQGQGFNPGVNPQTPGNSRQRPPHLPATPYQGPEASGVGGYFVGGGQYQAHPLLGTQRMTPMYVPRWSPGGAGPAGGGAQGDQTRRRLPVPGRHAMITDHPEWGQTQYDDGTVETWHVSDGPSWEGVGGMGAGYHGEPPHARQAGWDRGTPGGGGSLWSIPSPSVDAGWGAQQVLRQQGGGTRPLADQPAGTAGGFAGPLAQTQGGGPGGGGGQYGSSYGASVFTTPDVTHGQQTPSQGQSQAPMWDAATPGPFMSNGVAGPSGGAGQGTLYRPGASDAGGGSYAGGFNPQRALAPPKTTGSYYGGPVTPQAASPLQRLLQQTGVIPLSAGRAAGTPGTV